MNKLLHLFFLASFLFSELAARADGYSGFAVAGQPDNDYTDWKPVTDTSGKEWPSHLKFPAAVANGSGWQPGQG